MIGFRIISHQFVSNQSYPASYSNVNDQFDHWNGYEVVDSGYYLYNTEAYVDYTKWYVKA